MKAILVQHGEAHSRDEDPDRPLTERGAADVRRLAASLERAGVRAARVCHSGRTRAAQSAAILQAALGGAAARREPDLGATDPVAPVAERLVQWQGVTLLAGHQPFMGRLLSRLLCGDEEALATAFVPGSAACLEHDEQEGRWRLLWLLRPELLG